MKTKITWLLMLLACLNLQAATHVQFFFSDPSYGLSVTTNRLVVLQAESGTSISGANVLLPFRLTGYTDTNGQITFSNLNGSAIGGWYHVSVPAPPQRADFDIWCQSTNLGLINGNTILGVFGASTYPPQSFAWAAGVADNRYALSTNIGGSYVLIGQLLSTSNSLYALIPSTNGFVTGAVTNGMVTFQFLTNQFYPLNSNPSNYVNASITNNLATTNYVNNATNGLATGTSLTNLVQSATNQLASTNYVWTSITTATNPLASQTYVQNATNALASTNYVNNATNQVLATSDAHLALGTNSVVFQLLVAQTNLLNAINTASNLLQNTKQPASTTLTNLSATGAFTNFLSAGTNITLSTNVSGNTVSVNATNQTFLTNGMTSLTQTNPAFVLYTYMLPGLTNGFVTAAVTNGLATTAYVQGYIAGLNILTNIIAAGTNVTLSTNMSGNTIFLNATNQTFLTNGFTTLATTNPATIVYTNILPGLSNLIYTIGANDTNFAATIGLNSTNFTLSVSNNIFTNLTANLNAASNSILNQINGKYVAATNGIAYGLTVNSNLIFGTKTNFLMTTNIIGINGAGDGNFNGTYIGIIGGSTWTNQLSTTFTLLLSAGTFYLQSNSVSYYSSTTVTNWSIVIGASPAPIGAYGSRWDFAGVQETSTGGREYWGSTTNQMPSDRPLNVHWYISNNIPQYGILYTN